MVVFSILKSSFASQHITIMLLYRKNNLSSRDFAYMINHLLSRCPNVDIITGDFNENGFNMSQIVLTQLTNFEQLVNDPTEIDGKMLDQIYVSKGRFLNISCLLKHIHFSDHDATIGEILNTIWW